MQDKEFAGFWRRFAALVIDTLIYTLVFGLPFRMALSSYFGQDMAYHKPLTIAVSCITALIYYAGFLCSRWQATPGKRIMSIYVASAADRGRISPERSVVRYLVLNGVTLLFLAVSVAVAPAPTAESVADQQRLGEIAFKKMRNIPLAGDDERFRLRMKRKVSVAQARLSPEEEQRFLDIGDKEINHIPLSEDDKTFEHEVLQRELSASNKISLVLWPMLLYGLVTALMVGLTEQKTGPHDLVAGTRVLHGRPAKPVA